MLIRKKLDKMPPKPKITRKRILECAYDLTLRDGFASLSSRTVANAAGCSVQPVFSHFPTMDSLREEVYRYACRQCAEEVLNQQEGQDLMTVMARWMLDLAKNRPNLFELLYLSDLTTTKSMPTTLMQALNHRKMVSIISEAHDLTQKQGEDILVRSSIFLMGIGTMVCINKMDIQDEEVLAMMGRTLDDFISGVHLQS